MPATAPTEVRIPSSWDDAVADKLSLPERLRYRSNLLGSDLRVTNFAGGNTSSKIAMKDPLSGEEVTVLWVKGSGGDLGSMDLSGFATLYMDKLEQLKGLYRGLEHEDEMVGYLPHCTFGLNPRAASIDTPLHAFIPHPYVDHMHPDAVIAIAAAADGEKLTREIWGGEVGWIPWQRPGFDLGLKLEKMVRENPKLRGIVLGQHGLFTWGMSDKACYESTLAVINRAAEYLAERAPAQPFGGRRIEPLAPAAREDYAVALMPILRGKLSAENGKVGHFTDAPEVLDFVCSQRIDELAALGTSCPDHFLRTKIWPLVVDVDPRQVTATEAATRLDGLLAAYRERYAAYYERCKHPDSPALRDSFPVIILVPGVGMFSFAKDKATARVSAEFYVNAINVMRGATAVSEYRGLDEQEAFNIEYWLLEEAKLKRMPPPKSLAAKVAVITGGAGGIGSATARRLLEEGAAVVLLDIDQKSLDERQAEIAKKHGADQVRTAVCNVTDEGSVLAAYRRAVREYGGIDILVNNAGISSAAPVEETTLEIWNKNISILATGYFLNAREAFRLMKTQGTGGAMVFIASKNGLAASVNASAYCTAKGAELHLARCLALEGAPLGIRVNSINPDAVLRGSKIWQGDWRKERAEAYKIGEGDLEEHYRQRSLLKRNVFPEDIAEAVYFLASERSAKSTGNIVNVDAGNAVSFTR